MLPWMRLFGVLILLMFVGTAKAQGFGPSTLQKSIFSLTEYHSEAEYDKANGIQHTTTRTLSRKCILNQQVYGWHPAWSGTAYQRYDFALLSTVGYYSYEIDPETGSYTTVHQWRETGLVEMAHHAATQVELTASLAGIANTTRFLGDDQARKTFCDSIVALLQYKDADGVCLDFDHILPRFAGKFNTLVSELATALHAWRKSATITVVLHPEGPEQGYLLPDLLPLVDRFIVMENELHGSDAKESGPVSPLFAGKWGESSFEHSIQTWLEKGIPKGKLLITVPYYGYEWPTATALPGSATKGKGKTVFLRDYERQDSSAYLQWDSTSTTGWLLREKGPEKRQLWIDQVSSLGEKYALIKKMDIAGAGIWALGYDHESDKYWNLLKGYFADCGAGESDQLTQDTKPVAPGMDGQTSAERNTWNWVWMLGGGVIALVIIVLVKKYL